MLSEVHYIAHNEVKVLLVYYCLQCTLLITLLSLGFFLPIVKLPINCDLRLLCLTCLLSNIEYCFFTVYYGLLGKLPIV